MNEKDILVGVLAINAEDCEVFLNPDTNELYYVDEMGYPYLIVGFELDTVPSGTSENLDSLFNGMPDDVIGVVVDGAYKWLLTDTKAYHVTADAVSYAAATTSYDVDYSMEYDEEMDDE